MNILGGVRKISFNIVKWLVIIFLTFMVLSILGAYIADKYFDNAAKKDSCADSGGAWDHGRDICIFGSEDPRTKKSECEGVKGIWNFEKKECLVK